MHYLGIDQTLQAPGFALVDAAGALVGTAVTRVGAKTRNAERLFLIHAFLQSFLTKHGVKELRAAIEGPSLASTHREYDMGEVSGVMRYAVYAISLTECVVVPPTSLKLFATGTGAASKEDVMNGVKRLWGVTLTDDNEADAFVLAQVARHVHTGVRCATRHQAEVVAAFRKPTRGMLPQARRLRTGTNI